MKAHLIYSLTWLRSRTRLIAAAPTTVRPVSELPDLNIDLLFNNAITSSSLMRPARAPDLPGTVGWRDPRMFCYGWQGLLIPKPAASAAPLCVENLKHR
jgi:hypothetical protein